MRVESRKWFEAKVQVADTAQDDGMHEFIVDAASFTEAEARLLRHVAKTIGGTVDVRRLRPAKFSDVAFSSDQSEGWFKVKVVIGAEDEHRQKAYPVVVQASGMEQSITVTKAMMAGSMVDYRIAEAKEWNLDAAVMKGG